MLRLRALIKRHWRLRQEIDDELRFHFDIPRGSVVHRRRTDTLRGGAPRAARIRPSRSHQGSRPPCPETRLLDDLKQDVGYGARALLRAPGFTCIALLTVGIGIGASSAIFSVLNAVPIFEILPSSVTLKTTRVRWRSKSQAGGHSNRLARWSIRALATSNADFDDLLMRGHVVLGSHVLCARQNNAHPS